MKEPVDYGEQDVVDLPGDKKAYRLRFKQDENRKPRYLIVDNDFKDRGGIPGLLTYTAEASNRITLKAQFVPTPRTTVRPGTTGPASKPAADDAHMTSFKWTVQRFEAREKSLGEENKFDSLRDSYPIAPLRRLGTASGAQLTFLRDGWTGIAERIRIQPGRVMGPPTRLKLSKTAQKCLIDDNNMRELFDAMGPLILPRTPRRLGESWTRTRDKEIRNFGKSVTTYRLTLDRVDEQPDGSLIAHVSINGNIKLVPDPMPAGAASNHNDKKNKKKETTTKPGRSVRHRRAVRPKEKHRDFKLDSAAVSGEYAFDITHGMLLEYTLRRESALSAEMESKELGKMSLISAESHTLRVKTTTLEPPKPIIVGGPKPPKDDPKDLLRTPTPNKNRGHPPGATTRPTRRARAKDYAERRREALERLRKRREAAMKRNGVTTQPATSQPVWPRHRRPTTRPSSNRYRRTTTQPGRLRPRPITSRPRPIIRKPATTQPAGSNSSGKSTPMPKARVHE